MKTATSIAALAGAFTFSGVAAAQGKTGLDLGVRAGYAIPLGTATKGDANGQQRDNDFSDTTSGAIPVGLEVNYRVLPMLALGVYGQYGFGFVGGNFKEVCDSGNSDCSVSDIRAGLQASYIAQLDGLEAWFGLTLGLERLAVSGEGNGSEATTVMMALPDFGVQGGVGFEVSPTFSIGPFVGLSLGRFSYGHLEGTSQSVLGSIKFDSHVHIPSDNRSFHEWLTIGIRGNFTP